MSRMRLAGLVIFTLFTLLMLGLSIAGEVQTTHHREGLPVAEMLSGLILAVALSAAAGGLWFQWLLRRRRNDGAGRSPLPGVPRSKYAVWAPAPKRRAAKPMRQSGPHARRQSRGKR